MTEYLSAIQLSRAAGISITQVDNWTRHGFLLTAEDSRPKQGVARRYDLFAVEIATRIGKLVREGMRLNEAHRKATNIEDRDLFKYDNGLLHHMRDGEVLNSQEVLAQAMEEAAGIALGRSDGKSMDLADLVEAFGEVIEAKGYRLVLAEPVGGGGDD